ncbi:restriction endonuclease subunit S [Paraburkholderia sediminicola]|uniref:restriction endonuclease subunit S n=1 Tax=Paraburkholderia sediminicola TaxID=458836 RepID=UPI0038BDC1BB
MAKSGKSRATPKLRFPEFSSMPRWEEKQLEALVSPVVREREKPAEPYTGLGVRSHGKGTFLKPQEIPEKNSMEYLYEVHADDLIVNITFAWEGALAIAQRIDNGALVSHRFPTYTFKEKSARSDFFRYSILDKQLIYQLGVISPGGAGRNRVLNKRDFLKLTRFVPTTAEQQKIAECLTSLDEVIAAQGQKMEALKAHKRGLTQQLFPREGETVPRLRFPEFRDAPEWKTHAFSKFVTALDAGVSVNSGDRPASNIEVGILKTSCVTGGVFDPSENKVVLESDELKRTKEPVRGNTIIISRMNTPALVGANAYVEADLANIFLPDRLWAAKPSPDGYMRFISYILSSEKGRASLSELATGTSASMKNISKSAVLELQISAPELPEQRKIADCLSSLDAQIAAESEKLGALRIQKKGLMQQLFPSPEEN